MLVLTAARNRGNETYLETRAQHRPFGSPPQKHTIQRHSPLQAEFWPHAAALYAGGQQWADQDPRGLLQPRAQYLAAAYPSFYYFPPWPMMPPLGLHNITSGPFVSR